MHKFILKIKYKYLKKLDKYYMLDSKKIFLNFDILKIQNRLHN